METLSAISRSANKLCFGLRCKHLVVANGDAAVGKRYVRSLKPTRKVLEELHKEYYIVKSPKKPDENQVQKQEIDFDNSPMQRPTSVTVQMFGTDTWPYISDWRREQLVKRSRRVLPLPVSLTGLGDGQMPRYWRHQMRKALKTLQRMKQHNIELCEKVTPSVRLFLDNFPEKASQLYPELYKNYLSSKNMLILRNKEPKSVTKPIQFPHDITNYIKKSDALLKKEEDGHRSIKEPPLFSDGVIDQDYDNYLKHHHLLQYLATGLQGIKADEYESEIEGWRDVLWKRNYGSPDPEYPSSSIPCSGCGAFLHCADPSIPGYMPSEKFKYFDDNDLRQERCQRCEYLQHFNVSIDVNVHPDEYPKLISEINSKNSMVIIMIDLLDFPCSIWPGIFNLIGERHKIYVVGNKVDLLPKDDSSYLHGVRQALKKSLFESGVNKNVRINHISLISAKTGFGVEELITCLMTDWKPNRDIYLIGCTNVGKSTLFNVLLQSDLCKLRENDLISRATTSFWPGTTLKLLKFPINKPPDYVIELRNRRLFRDKFFKNEEKLLKRRMYRQTRNKQYATLSDRVGMTWKSNVPFTVQSGHPFAKKSVLQQPFNPDSRYFRNCNFFYDTPGTIYKDQILTLLTTEELLKTIPRELITPRTFVMKPLQSLFIGGLARIDLVKARQHVWFTVFASNYLPVHIVYTEEAKRFYEGYIGTDMLGVPFGNEERLKYWPQLLPKEFELESIDWTESCADIVLSSAGWTSITQGPDTHCVVRAFTPEGRGIFLRKPCVLPFGFRLRGKRIRGTPCFENKLFTIDDFIEKEEIIKFPDYDLRRFRKDNS